MLVGAKCPALHGNPGRDEPSGLSALDEGNGR